ncbi:MAG: PKD domain-containing protein [Candidatus Hydrogenedentes bacterium]|nr:PKD domain-containing protein [Candidatus Hydrogenedentota bacterium]
MALICVVTTFGSSSSAAFLIKLDDAILPPGQIGEVNLWLERTDENDAPTKVQFRVEFDPSIVQLLDDETGPLIPDSLLRLWYSKNVEVVPLADGAATVTVSGGERQITTFDDQRPAGEPLRQVNPFPLGALRFYACGSPEAYGSISTTVISSVDGGGKTLQPPVSHVATIGIGPLVPFLSVTPAILEIPADEETTVIQIRNLGAGNLQPTAQVTSGGEWLNIVPCSNAVYAFPGRNLTKTTQTAVIRIEAPGAENSPLDVPVVKAGIPTLPKADFDAAPRQGVAPLAVQFTDKSQPTDQVIYWSWDFGDGSLPGKEQNPQHTYSRPGVYTVGLKVDDLSGSPIPQEIKNDLITVTQQVTLRFYVSTAGNDVDGNGTREKPFATVSRAMRDAGNVATDTQPAEIYLMRDTSGQPALFEEQVIFAPNVHLSGEGPESPSPQSFVLRFFSEAATPNAVVIGGRNAQLENCTVTMPAARTEFFELVDIEEKPMTMKNVILDGARSLNSIGLRIVGRGSSDSKVENCLFRYLNLGIFAVESGARFSRNHFENISVNDDSDAIIVGFTGKANPPTPLFGNAGNLKDTGFNLFENVSDKFIFYQERRDTSTDAEYNDWGFDDPKDIALHIDEKASVNIAHHIRSVTKIVPGAIIGTIFEEGTTQPVKGTTSDVNISLLGGKTAAIYDPENGVYTFPAVSAGSSRIDVNVTGYTGQSRRISHNGVETKVENFVLQRQGTTTPTPTPGGCAAKIAFQDQPELLDALRRFRDQGLGKSALGKTLVEGYYRVAPGLAGAVKSSSDVRAMFIALAGPFATLGRRL